MMLGGDTRKTDTHYNVFLSMTWIARTEDVTNIGLHLKFIYVKVDVPI